MDSVSGIAFGVAAFQRTVAPPPLACRRFLRRK